MIYGVVKERWCICIVHNNRLDGQELLEVVIVIIVNLSLMQAGRS